MNILITGANSFVGNAIKNASSEHFIREVCLLSSTVDSIDFIGIDTVLHLAAIVHQKKGTLEELYFRVNRDLAIEVAKKAKKAGVKHFVFMSTVKVYGESTHQIAWNEESNCAPQDAYGKSKFEAEQLLVNLSDDQFKVAIVRSPLVYGPGVKANMYNLVKMVYNFPVLPFGKINNKRSMVFIGNLIALLNHIIEKKAFGLFLASDPAPLSTSQITTTIALSLQKNVHLIALPGVVLRFINSILPGLYTRLYGSLEIDASQTNKTLGYSPPFTSQHGINEMVKWYISSNNKMA